MRDDLFDNLQMFRKVCPGVGYLPATSLSCLKASERVKVDDSNCIKLESFLPGKTAGKTGVAPGVAPGVARVTCK